MAIKDLAKCDKACIDCIRSYAKKHKLVPGQKFEIPCKGIVKYGEQLDIFGEMGEAEKEAALSVLDPVEWAAQTLDWHCVDMDGSVWKRRNPEEYQNWVLNHPGESIEGKSRYHRPYQELVLRCSARRKVLRCVDPNTEITLENGKTQIMKDLKVGDRVVSINEKDLTSNISTVLDIVSTGIKTRYKVKTKQGHEVIVSDDHPFLAKQGLVDKSHDYFIQDLPTQWKTIKQGLQIGDRIAICNNSSVSPQSDNLEITDNHLKILGYFITDGSYGKSQSAKFTNNNILYLKEFEDCCKNLGSSCKWYPKAKGFDLVVSNGRSVPNPVSKWFESIGCKDVVMENRILPDFIFSLGKRQSGILLNRMWAGDGWVEVVKRKNRDNYRCSLGIASTALSYLKQIKALLLKFGINSYIRIESKKSYKGTRDFYKLHISKSRDILNFFELIGGEIFGKEKQSALGKLIATQNKDNDLVKSEGVVTWDYIKSIELLPADELFDISLDTIHTFIANSSIILHNCGRQLGKSQAIMVSILYHLFTKPGIPENEGFKVVILTPFQAQIDLLFKGMEDLLKNSPTSQNSIKRNVKAPVYTLTLHNGSEVKGFTAGTKSGGNADAIRGQTCHFLIFDEGDYLAPKDLESALSLITNHPEASVWMSSTPTGKREKFYSLCLSKDWKEFYYTSHSNPMFTTDVDNLFKSSLSSLAYKHEILAEFGEQEEGVFQNAYVQEAKADYRYGEIPRRDSWIYTVGVDWNDTAIGTTIAVLGFNPMNNIFTLVDSQIVSRDGWTQLSACEKIRDINRIWRPKTIYIDAGHGGTQYEILTKYGHDSMADPSKGPGHADAKLANIIKRYDFGSKVEVHDLWTHQPIDKPAKPFLVETATRRFEAHDIKFSKYDEKLEKQLQGYVIDRITPTGVPVYKASSETIGDHSLDALMLAIVGFVLEITPLGSPRFTSKIAFSGYFGEKIQPDVFPGDTVITNDKPQERRSDKVRPEMSRMSGVEKVGLTGVSAEMPGNHMGEGTTNVGVWSWPGFMNDSPKPRVQTLQEAEQSARKRLGIFRPRVGRRSHRKNI